MTTSTRDRILTAAAEARAAGVTQRSHRPTQRRSGEQPGSTSGVTVRAQHLELRAAESDTGLLHFTGFASVYDRSYEMWDWYGPYAEQVSSGAGATSLARADLDVPLVIQHKPETVMARTTNGSLVLDERVEDVDGDPVEGLWTDAPALDPTDRHVSEMAPKLRSGLYDEMSFRFRILKGEWSPDWDEYHIKEYDIHRGDVSVVMYGANPHTQGAGIRSLPTLEDLTDAQLREVERRLGTLLVQRTGQNPPAADTPSGLSRLQIGALADLL